MISLLCISTLILEKVNGKEKIPKTPFKVIIDPGHGGKDRGAIVGDIEEAELVLKVALFLSQILKQDSSFHPVLTRSQDHFISLHDRTQIAIQEKGDVFISLHLNTSKNKKRKGGEIYFQNHFPPEEESMLLAQMENQGKKTFAKNMGERNTEEPTNELARSSEMSSILNDLKRSYKIFMSALLATSFIPKKPTSSQKKYLKHHFTSILQAPFYVIYHVNMPAVLVELGFITHKAESQKLKKPFFQKHLAQHIYLSLKRFKESLNSSLSFP